MNLFRAFWSINLLFKFKYRVSQTTFPLYLLLIMYIHFSLVSVTDKYIQEGESVFLYIQKVYSWTRFCFNSIDNNSSYISKSECLSKTTAITDYLEDWLWMKFKKSEKLIKLWLEKLKGLLKCMWIFILTQSVAFTLTFKIWNGFYVILLKYKSILTFWQYIK